MNSSTTIRFTTALLFAITIATSTAQAEIPWQRSPERTLQSARQSGKPIVVFVTTQWCHYCQKMKKQTWSDGQVQATISRDFEPLMLDGDKDQQIVKQLGIRGYPATLVYDSHGSFLAMKSGFMTPEVATNWLSATRRR
ncbi:Thioredoxin-like [Neorhodopirellula lusitana]|uniref:Thioredoxin-like n=1 Tax=Neorhodopirellula lusitana TaxID=445327 RepID=A0ABY1Q249_9BACT|nr:thioredoxin family protein [Neorhodopirellula lusitana]SMP56934.1 Thioredoxin-like [Neorhodopirellula lusitana]